MCQNMWTPNWWLYFWLPFKTSQERDHKNRKILAGPNFAGTPNRVGCGCRTTQCFKLLKKRSATSWCCAGYADAEIRIPIFRPKRPPKKTVLQSARKRPAPPKNKKNRRGIPANRPCNKQKDILEKQAASVGRGAVSGGEDQGPVLLPGLGIHKASTWVPQNRQGPFLDSEGKTPRGRHCLKIPYVFPRVSPENLGRRTSPKGSDPAVLKLCGI